MGALLQLAASVAHIIGLETSYANTSFRYGALDYDLYVTIAAWCFYFEALVRN